MMESKLLKQLKEAGFPQMFKADKLGMKDLIVKEEVYIPTLSELIDACGDGFWNLCRDMEGKWIATAWRKNFDDKQIMTVGKTYKEALAKLFIELNK